MTSVSWTGALERLDGAYAQNTLLAYRSDYADFAVWCHRHDVSAYPTNSLHLLSYLEQLPHRLKPTTVRRRIIAIGRVHVLNGYDDPANSIDIALALRRRYRRHGAFPQQAYGLTRERLQVLLDACEQDVRGLRDRAMLMIGFESLCRKNELVRLTVEDIGSTLRGHPAILIRESKNGPFVRERWAVLSRHAMGALNAWLDVSGITSGPVFRPVYANSVIARQICGYTLVRVLKELAQRAGLPAETIRHISGHSLRVGAAQQLALNGYDIAQIMRVGGWKSITALSRYIEGAAVNVWDGNWALK